MARDNFTETPFDDQINLEERLGRVAESIIFRGWTPEMISHFMAETEATMRAYRSGEMIVEKDEVADGMYLIAKGSVRILGLDLELTAPTCFGEAAVLLSLEGRYSLEDPCSSDATQSITEVRNASIISLGYEGKGKGPAELVFLPGEQIMDLEFNRPDSLIHFYCGLVRLAHARIGEMNDRYVDIVQENARLKAGLGK